MDADWGAVDELARAVNLKFTLEFAGESFALESARIARVSAPVKKRTERGGAYFTDSQIYQARVRTREKAIVQLIPKAMLGPNTEFGDVKLLTVTELGSKQVRATLHTNLTSSVEGPSGIELVLRVTGIELDGIR